MSTITTSKCEHRKKQHSTLSHLLLLDGWDLVIPEKRGHVLSGVGHGDQRSIRLLKRKAESEVAMCESASVRKRGRKGYTVKRETDEECEGENSDRARQRRVEKSD